MATREPYQLTPHPVGSILEFWTLCWPLMIAMVSATLMIFVDRLFLARYDPLTLNGGATGGAAYWLCLVLPMGIAAISEVLVGRFHGAGIKSEVGPAAWQMVLFSLFQIPLFVVVAKFGPTLFFWGSDNSELETIYFQILTLFGWVQCLNVALSGFFVGIGDVKKVTIASLVGNGVNILLDLLFIFGFGPIPEMGIAGAALATGLSMIVQSLFLFVPYFSKENREYYNTNAIGFRKNYLMESLQIGIPSGAARVAEVIGHFLFLRFVALSGQDQMTIIAMVQSLYILVSFVADAEAKVSSTIAANLIGAKHMGQMQKVFFSGGLLHALFALVFMAPLFLAPEFFLDLFACRDAFCLASSDLLFSLKACLILMGLFFFLDGISWILNGFLTAAGDTVFIFWLNIILNLMAYMLPAWWFLVVMKQGAVAAWSIIVCMSVLVLLSYLYRFYSGSWLKKLPK